MSTQGTVRAQLSIPSSSLFLSHLLLPTFPFLLSALATCFPLLLVLGRKMMTFSFYKAYADTQTLIGNIRNKTYEYNSSLSDTQIKYTGRTRKQLKLPEYSPGLQLCVTLGLFTFSTQPTILQTCNAPTLSFLPLL